MNNMWGEFISKDILKFLSNLPLFSLLPKKELRKIAGNVSIKQFRKGRLKAVQGKTKLKSISVVAEGVLSLYYETDGKKILGGYHKQGEVFGGIALLMNAGFSTKTVIVEDNCLLYNIPKDIFLDVCTRFNSFYDYFLETFGRNMLDESLDLFIKDQVEQWEEESKAHIPIITISTEPGSGGSIIAQKIAERLELDLF